MESIKKISPLRIVIGTVTAFILLMAALFIDDSFANAPYYKNLDPRWTPDGKFIVYYKWFPYKYSTPNSFEVWKTDITKNNSILLYRPEKGYNIYGIRRLKFSSDGNYINLRLNKKVPGSGEIKDLLVKIPISGTGEVSSWELDKKHQYDIFLAFKDDRVLLRRDSGRNVSAKITEFRFSDRKPVKTYQFPDDKICSFADFYGDDNRLFGVLIKDCRNKGICSWIYDFKTGNSFEIDKTFYQLFYLEKSNTLIRVDAPSLIDIYQINLKDLTMKTIANPLKTSQHNEIYVLPDESAVIITDNFEVKRVNLINYKITSISNLAGSFIQNIDVNPENNNIAFDDGETIYTADMDGNNRTKFIPESIKSKYEKNSIYQKYISIRKIIISERH
jgi:hypothetical protein